MSAHNEYSIDDIPEVHLGTYLLQCMKESGDMIAVVDGNTDLQLTYRQFIQRIERVAAGLQKIGVSKDDVVCIASPTHVDFLTACYATILVSATCQPVNPTYTKDDINRAIQICNTKYVMTIPEILPVVRAGIQAAGNGTIKVIVFGKAPGCIPFDHLLDPSHGKYETHPVEPKTDVPLLLSSSGTTGLPKAVKLTHYAITALVQQLKWSGTVHPVDAVIVFLPLFHVYGLCNLTLSAHASRGKVVLMSKFVPETFFSLIEKHKPRMLNAVPPVIVQMAKHPRMGDYDLSSVQGIMSGAAPLSPDVGEVVKKRLELKLIHQGYGMTETGVTHINTDTAYRHGSVGKTLPLIKSKIVDAETGKTLGTNEEGEIWIRGPQVSIGYLNMPTETEHMFLKDGWVRTGDVGKQDEDGYLYVVDRIKELIKYKGFQVAPAVLEGILQHHHKVADAGVVGVPDVEAGELPKAYVVKKAGAKLTAGELINYVAARVSPHMKLRGGLQFLQEIPRSLSGKILRRKLKQQGQGRPMASKM